MSYKEIVEEINNLPWSSLSSEGLEKLMIISAYNALEFAESLRLLLKEFPENSQLIEMASGELETDNLEYKDYNLHGDHSSFLWFFIEKHGLLKKYINAGEIGENYLREIRSLNERIRALSVVSREEELHKIFEKIRKNPNFNTEALEAYAFYLDKHIVFDSESGGHSDLVSEIELDDSIEEFYKIRLETYQELFNL